MNVAIFGPRYSPNYDGVGDHAAWIADALIDAGHDVVVVTESLAARPRCEVVRIGRWDLRALGTIAAALRGRRIDVALFEYTPFNFGSRTFTPHALAIALRLRGTRVATFLHEAFYRPRGTNPMPPLKALALGVRDAVMTAASHAVFAASPERADAIVAAVPFFRSRVHVIPIGANVEPAPREIWTPPPGPPYRLVTFGVVAARRRIDLIVEMIARAAQRGIRIELTVLGRIYDRAYAERCETRARDLAVADRVRFTRELPPAEVTRTMSDAHLAVHALYEGAISSSGSLLAVLAHGIPLLAVRTPRDERIFESLAVFTSEDPDAMLDDALALIASSDGGAALGRRARARYESDFAWRSIAERSIAAAFVPMREVAHARG